MGVFTFSEKTQTFALCKFPVGEDTGAVNVSLKGLHVNSP